MFSDQYTGALSGQVAVVTGAGEDLGGHFAKVLARAGARVALLDKNKNAALPYATGILESGGIAKAYACDALSEDACKTVAENVTRDFGNCRILVNCAGCAMEESEIADENDEFGLIDGRKLSEVLSRRLLSALIPTMAFASHMSDGSTVINVTSVGADIPIPTFPVHSAAEAAVESLTKWMANWMAKSGVRVNALRRGFFYCIGDKSLQWSEGVPSPQTARILDATPMGRGGEKEETDGTLLFLADKKASGFVNGAVIAVDGGLSVHRI